MFLIAINEKKCTAHHWPLTYMLTRRKLKNDFSFNFAEELLRGSLCIGLDFSTVFHFQSNIIFNLICPVWVVIHARSAYQCTFYCVDEMLLNESKKRDEWRALFYQFIAISFNNAIMAWMPFIVLFISSNDKEIASHSASFGLNGMVWCSFRFTHFNVQNAHCAHHYNF